MKALEFFLDYVEKKKCPFSRFQSLQFCAIPKIGNSEISENFLLVNFLIVYETQNLKIDWKMTLIERAGQDEAVKIVQFNGKESYRIIAKDETTILAPDT